MADGIGCKCFASYQGECACDADWTPSEVYELRANINDLREAFRKIRSCYGDGYEVDNIARQALSKTPAQHINDDVLIFTKDSLQEHDNEVIEKCAKVCDEHGAIWVAKSIRALKKSS